MKRPNILFLMSDEHRADVAGYAGNSVVRTPFLDELAQSGVVFTNAYTPSPICVPSRQCLAAGQLPNTCGCRVFADDLKPGHMTFARRFAQYGYTTAACGKLHHHGPDQMQGWLQRPGGDVSMEARHIEGYLPEEAARYPSPLDQKWSDSKEIQRAGVGYGDNAERDEYAVLGALRFIKEHFASPYYDRERHNPVLLKVSLNQPHYPYLTTEDKFTYYLNRVQPYVDEQVHDHPFLSQRQVRPNLDVSERELRRATAAYYGMIETADEQFRRVAAALAQVGQNLEDWIVIYTSDHGEMLGEHGIWEKQKFFEASVRVPLLIRWPQKLAGGRMVDSNVNLCDLFATLCELTEIPVPSGLDSRSLVPLLQGDDTGWDNETVSHFRGHAMIKRDHLKYQYYGEEMPEVLFDLERNPGETVNYAADPAYAQSLERFRERLGELGYGKNASADYVNAGYRSR